MCVMIEHFNGNYSSFLLHIKLTSSSTSKGIVLCPALTLNLLTTTIVAPLSNASKWQMGFNSAFKRLIGSAGIR